jgi:hypothetical protein
MSLYDFIRTVMDVIAAGRTSGQRPTELAT